MFHLQAGRQLQSVTGQSSLCGHLGTGTPQADGQTIDPRFSFAPQDNWPEMRVTLQDLSPFYLEQAKRNMAYWRRVRMPQLDIGGVDGTGVSYIQAAAENIPLPDASVDVVREACTRLDSQTGESDMRLVWRGRCA
jgi:hypothetical protein